jgi:hypothetical protein
MRAAGQGGHLCAVCGASAAFGFGPPFRPDQVWTCAAHKAQGAPMRDAHGPIARKARAKAPSDARAPDLFGGR